MKEQRTRLRGGQAVLGRGWAGKGLEEGVILGPKREPTVKELVEESPMWLEQRAQQLPRSQVRMSQACLRTENGGTL